MTVTTINYAITVASGTGGTNVTVPPGVVVRSARIDTAGIKAPNANASYSFKILDADGYKIYDETGITGDASLAMNRLCKNGIVPTIYSASVDGVYNVRLYIEN